MFRRSAIATYFAAGPQAAGQTSIFRGKYWVQVVSATPYLVVGAMRKDSASYLFAPFGLFRGQTRP